MAKKKAKKHLPLIIGYCVVGFAVFWLVLFLCFYVSERNRSDNDSGAHSYNSGIKETAGVDDAGKPSDPQASTPELTEAEWISIEFPQVLCEGKVEINSVFSYTGSNPDCNWQEAESVGAVVVQNTSDQYLERLDLALKLANGTELKYEITSLPAGKTVWAFDVNNNAYMESDRVIDVQSSSVFKDNQGLSSDVVSVSVSGMDVALSNHDSETLNGLNVYCRTEIDGVYFGGKAYVYHVAQILPDTQEHVMAYDCLLGIAEVICVDFSQPS